MAQQIDAKDPSVINPAGVDQELDEDEKLKKVIRTLSKNELDEMNKDKAEPAMYRRKTMGDRLRRDTTAISLHQMAAASYDAELNKFNVRFQPATMA